MLRAPKAYDTALNAFSNSITPRIRYEMEGQERLTVLNKTDRLYRYYDAIPQAEFLYEAVAETIRKDLREEIEFLEVFNKSMAAVKAIVDMPNQRASSLIRFVLQIHGRLSTNLVQGIGEGAGFCATCVLRGLWHSLILSSKRLIKLPPNGILGNSRCIPTRTYSNCSVLFFPLRRRWIMPISRSSCKGSLHDPARMYELVRKRQVGLLRLVHGADAVFYFWAPFAVKIQRLSRRPTYFGRGSLTLPAKTSLLRQLIRFFVLLVCIWVPILRLLGLTETWAGIWCSMIYFCNSDSVALPGWPFET